MKNRIFAGLLSAIFLLLSWNVGTSFVRHADAAATPAVVVPDPAEKAVVTPKDIVVKEQEHTTPTKSQEVKPAKSTTADPAPPYTFTVPDQKIVLDASVDAGETVFAKLSDVTTPPQYLTTSTYHWKVFQDGTEKVNNVQEWPDGSSVAFGSGVVAGRKFTVIVACEYLYLVKDSNGAVLAVGQRSKMLTASTTVGGTPAPPVPPTPGPPIPVPPGPSAFGLQLQQAFTNDADPNKIADAVFVGQCVKVAASLIQDGKPHTVGSIETSLFDTINSKFKSGQLSNSIGVMKGELTSFLGTDLSKTVEVPATVAELQKIATAWQSVK